MAPLLESPAKAAPSGRLVVVCAWCEKVRSAGDLWREARIGEEFGTRVSHGICPDCIIRWTSSFSREDGQR
jgi:hypothetical protein